MSTPPTWVDVEHQQQEVLVPLPVDAALRLKTALPLLMNLLGEGRGRNAGERDDKRETAAALEVLMQQLAEALRPYDVP
jgi:hypothetical protein